MRTLILPEPIAAYFAADQQNPEALARCFTPQAVVKDEGHTYAGLEAIKAWKATASARYSYTSEPLALAKDDGLQVVRSRVSATSPAAPSIFITAFDLNAA